MNAVVTNNAAWRRTLGLKETPKREATQQRGRGQGWLKELRYANKGKGGWGVISKTALNASSGQTGGYIAPTGYSLALMDSIEEHELIEPRALVVPLETDETLCPMPTASVAQSAGTSPFFGGINFSWQSATLGTSLSETEPTFRQVSLKTNTLIGQLVVANQFLDDVGEEGELALMRLFGRAAAWYKDYFFINGKGADNSQPIGLLNAQCLLKVNRNAGSNIQLVDVATMASKLIPYCWNNSIWITSPSSIAKICQITGFFPNVAHDGAPNGSSGALLTRPLYVTEKLPALGTLGDLILFDPSLYVVGKRTDVIIEASPHPMFNTQQTVFRVQIRCTGKPMLDGSVTLADASSTASSVILLN